MSSALILKPRTDNGEKIKTSAETDFQKGYFIPAFHLSAGYHRTNLPAGGVMPYARLPGLSVAWGPVTDLGSPVSAAVPPDPNRVPMNDPGFPTAYRFPTPNAGWTPGTVTAGVTIPVELPGDTAPGTDVAIGATGLTGDEVGKVIEPPDVGIGIGDPPVVIGIGTSTVGIGVCPPAVGITVGTTMVGAAVDTPDVGTGVGTMPGDEVPTFRAPGIAVTGYRSPLRFWTPMLESGVIVIPVLPVAVPFTVRVARRTLVAPMGTCCDRSTAWRTTCPDGRADADFSPAQSGKATAVIVAIDGSFRFTVIR